MSYSPPEPPSPERKSLDFDEFIAVAVAFISIGFILLWSLTRKETHFRTVAGDLLGEQPQVETAAKGKPSGGQPSEISSLEASKQSTPLQSFQVQPDTPDKFAESGDSVSLGLLYTAPQPSLNNRDSFSRVSEEDGLPSQLAPNITIQSEGDDLEPVLPIQADPQSLGGELPDLPSQPLASALTPFEPLAAPLEFSDVSDEYWGIAFIDALSARGLLSGFPDGSFRPDEPLTRAELAALIAKVFTLEVRRSTLDFGDISETYWAASEIKGAVTAGFMRGYPEEIFKPDQAVSRVQVLVAIVSGLELVSNADPISTLERYQDRDEIPNWAIAAVATATEMELIVNYPNLERLQPNKSATRAEVAAILNRVLVRLGELDDSSSSFIVRP